MAKQNRYSGKRVETGPLEGHYRRGRKYAAPIAALPGSTANDWVKDDLPDLIWPLLLVASGGHKRAIALSRFQESLFHTLGPNTIQGDGLACDGRLTSLDRMPNEVRRPILQAVREFLGDLLPAEILGVLRLYPSIPGGWLLVTPWSDMAAPSEEESIDFLASSIVKVVSDRHLNALTKTPPLTWALMNGKLHTASAANDFAEMLIDYPIVPEKVGPADAYILSSFLSFKAMDELADESIKPARLDWARRFWIHNRYLTACVFEHELRGEQAEVDQPEGEPRETAWRKHPRIPISL